MITIRSVYDIKAFRVFQKYSLFKVFILSYICALCLIGVGILLFFLEKSSTSIYVLCGVLLPIGVHIIYKIQEIEAINKNNMLRDTTMQIFNFNEEGFELEQISSDGSFKDKYLYKDVYSIIKYKRYYFIYINRVQAFVVSNQDYVYGNEKELDELFKKVKKERFIMKRNSKRK